MANKLDSKSVISTVVNGCRVRSITHVVMSPAAYGVYRKSITINEITKGVRYASIYGRGILVLDGIKDQLVFFLDNRNEIARLLIELIREENYGLSIEVIDSNLESPLPRWMKISTLKEKK